MVDAQCRLDLVDVVADAVGAPQVGHGVLVAGVILLKLFEQFWVQVLPVRQLAAVQRQEGASLGLPGEEVVRRHHHVVAGASGQQFSLQGFVGIEHVIDHLDPAAGLEVGQGRVTDVVGPVVHADGRCGLGGSAEQ
ncbi:hypothetical protein D3C81_1389830 [compost metagenome]